jgi:hypothetical protein
MGCGARRLIARTAIVERGSAKTLYRARLRIADFIDPW